jgi:gluconolactonase
LNHPEPVADGIPFPEGLAWMREDECLLCSSVQEGVVYRVWPGRSGRELFADVGGGANNLAPARDGGAVVCQNGGVDAGLPMAARYPDMAPLPPVRRATPGLMHVARDGRVRYILDRGVNAPNDIAVLPDGALVFTDPGNPFVSPRPAPRLMRFSPDHGLSVWADGFDYCNGVFVDGETVLVTDHGGVLRLSPDGAREWVIRYADRNVDGLAVDTSGRLYVARQARGGVDVVEDGSVVAFLELPGETMVTNVCFGGPEGLWLFATDARRGAVHVFADMPAPGLPVGEWDPAELTNGRAA